MSTAADLARALDLALESKRILREILRRPALPPVAREVVRAKSHRLYFESPLDDADALALAVEGFDVRHQRRFECEACGNAYDRDRTCVSVHRIADTHPTAFGLCEACDLELRACERCG